MRSGVLGEFDSPDALERAHAALVRQGYERLETWTPYAVASIVKTKSETIVPWIMLVAALVGGGLGYWLQWWCNAVSFPIDVGGRPLHSAPAFIPITFESAVLFSCVTGFIAMLWVCHLPRLHHPLFEIEGFERSSVDRFWLGVDDTDPRFRPDVEAELTKLGALRCERLGDPS